MERTLRVVPKGSMTSSSAGHDNGESRVRVPVAPCRGATVAYGGGAKDTDAAARREVVAKETSLERGEALDVEAPCRVRGEGLTAESVYAQFDHVLSGDPVNGQRGAVAK